MATIDLSYLHFNEEHYERLFLGKVLAFLLKAKVQHNSSSSSSSDSINNSNNDNKDNSNRDSNSNSNSDSNSNSNHSNGKNNSERESDHKSCSLGLFDARCAALLERMETELETESSHNSTATTSDSDNISFIGPCHLIRSPTKHCRQRVRFQLVHSNSSGSDNEGQLLYAMWENGGPNAIISQFPIASEVICQLMPLLLDELNQATIPQQGIQAVSFLSSTLGDVVVTLIYDERGTLVDSESLWKESVQGICDRMTSSLQSSNSKYLLRGLSVIGRSKGKKVTVGSNFVLEELFLERYDGRTLKYKQVDDGFSNPNAVVNMRALDWLCHIVKDTILPYTLEHPEVGRDLLEMYCGNGNHTVAMAGYFKGVMAVEINDKLCDAAKENFRLNNISNARIMACNSCKFASRILNYTTFSYRPLQQRRTTRRYAPAIDTPIDESDSDSDSPMDFHFGTVLVDPPRAGLDPTTLQAVSNYDHIIYISCNPNALLENLSKLSNTHEICNLAAFDHFAYTEHLEIGVVLRRRRVNSID